MTNRSMRTGRAGIVARRRRRALTGRQQAPRGFTIIELIVAIVIMVVGVLGLAGTAAMVSRMVGGAAQQTVAANVAASRFEKLRSTACSQVVGGTATTRNISEKWTVTADPSSASRSIVLDSVTYQAAGGLTRRLAFESYIRC